MKSRALAQLFLSGTFFSLTTCFATSQVVLWENVTVDSNSVAYAQSGEFILASCDRFVVKLNPTNGETLARFKVPGVTRFRTLSLNSTSTRFSVAYNTLAGFKVGVFDATNGIQIAELDPMVNVIVRTAWNPSGSKLAIIGSATGSGVVIYDNDVWGTPSVVCNDPVNPIQLYNRGLAWGAENLVMAVDMGTATTKPAFRSWIASTGVRLNYTPFGLNEHWAESMSGKDSFVVAATSTFPSPANIVRINRTTGIVDATITSDSGYVDLAHAPNGNFVAAVAFNRLLVANASLSAVHSQSIVGANARAIAVAPDSLKAAVATTNGVRLYTFASPAWSGFASLTWQHATDALPSLGIDLAVSPNGAYVITGTANGSVAKAYDANSGNVLWGANVLGEFAWVRGVGISPDSSRVMFSTWPAGSGQLDFFNSANGGNAASVLFPEAPHLASGKYISSSRIFTLGAATRKVYIRNTDGTIFGESPALGAGGSLTQSAVSPDSSKIAVGSGNSLSSSLYILDATSPTVPILQSFVFGSVSVNWVDWKGNVIFVAAGPILFRFDATNLAAGPTLISSLPASVTAMKASPDGRYLAACTNNTLDGLRIYRLADSSLAAYFPSISEIYAMDYFPDNSRIAMVRANGQILVIENPFGPFLGGTVFWEGPNSGLLPRLMVGWRTTSGVVVLPTVVIDIAPTDWQVRTVGSVNGDATDDLIWQNTNPGFSIPGLVAYWTLSSSGVPSPAGTGGAPPAIDWVVKGFNDATGDGNADILWLNQSTGMIALWFRDEGGNVTGTTVVGSQPSGSNLICAANTDGNPGLELFFQNSISTSVDYWSLNSTGGQIGSGSIGVPAANWLLEGVGSFQPLSNGLLFRNSATNQLAYWNIDSAGQVTGTGTLGEAPAGWTILAVGKL
ncbi:MAG: hypothetical protein ACK4P3_04765 [Fimbriimonadaceae bacterium]